MSPEALTYFFTGNSEFNHKAIIKLAKIKGIDVDASESNTSRKNLENFFLGKHVSTGTTLKNIKTLIKKLVENDQFSDIANNINLLDKVDISTSESKLKYTESLYSHFFNSSPALEGSFLKSEVNKTFAGIKEAVLLMEQSSVKSEVLRKLNKSQSLPKINYNDCLYLEIEKKISTFSLDLLLYYFACLEVEFEKEGQTPLELMFKYFNQDVNSDSVINLKSAFEYYIQIVQYFSEIEGRKVTSNEIAAALGIDERTYHHYKSGKRKLRFKTITLLINNGWLFYFFIVFWKRLLEDFTIDQKINPLLVNKINKYSSFLEIAKIEFKQFESLTKLN